VDDLIPSITKILNMKEPGELYSGNPDTIKEEYANLAKAHHPDKNGNTDEATEAMAKINDWYQLSLELIKDGKWMTPGVIKLSAKDNKTYEVKYRVAHDFELGKMYIGNTVVLYLVNNLHKDLFDNTSKIINGFTFASSDMKEEVSKYLPKILAKFETKDDQLGIVIQKTPDLFLLKDVLEYFDGKVPDRHVAWILSSLYNITCYMDYAKLSQNAISLDTYFISTKYHSGSLLGGWWYSVPQGEKMLGVSEKVYSVMPPQVKSKKSGNIQTDLEAIRLIGRELLGDKNGTKLASMGIPQPFIDWLRGVSSTKALKDYSDWREVLNKSYGERKFVELNIDDKEFYEKIKRKR